MPLKIEALALAGDHRPGRAGETGAANLLLPGGATVFAENSDVVAVERLLEPHFRANGHIVAHLIGTGGAAAAAAAALRQVGPPVSLFTYARSEESALAFRRRAGLEDSPVYCHVLGESEPWGSFADVVINATPLGMTGQDALAFPLTHFEPGALVFDMVYSPLETDLLAEARARGMRVLDGLHMLVEQAAMSFAMFFSHDAPREHDEELRKLLTT
jgi:shikimate dehydrogenase